MHREDFTMLDSDIVFFDNGATTLKPKCVVDSMIDYYTKHTSNIHRGDYAAAIKTNKLYDDTRSVVAKFINSDSDEVIFTSGTTMSINMVVFGFMKKVLNKGDEVLLTKSEHASNVLPWIKLSEEIGVVIGNFSLLGAGDNTGEPFIIMLQGPEDSLVIGTTDEGESHNVGIKIVAYSTIKKTYLPDDVVYAPKDYLNSIFDLNKFALAEFNHSDFFQYFNAVKGTTVETRMTKESFDKLRELIHSFGVVFYRGKIVDYLAGDRFIFTYPEYAVTSTGMLNYSVSIHIYRYTIEWDDDKQVATVLLEYGSK